MPPKKQVENLNPRTWLQDIPGEVVSYEINSDGVAHYTVRHSPWTNNHWTSNLGSAGGSHTGTLYQAFESFDYGAGLATPPPKAVAVEGDPFRRTKKSEPTPELDWLRGQVDEICKYAFAD
jgi:hypothetical protein